MKKSANRRKGGKIVPPGKKQIEDLAAYAGLQKLPTHALVTMANAILAIVQERGCKIRDWDDKSKVFYKITAIGGKIYILAPRETPTEAGTHVKDGDEKQGG